VISIFHVVALIGCVVGLVHGAILGNMLFGWVGTLLGVFPGAYIGLVIGRLPRLVVCWFLRRKQPTISGQTDIHG
jgi:hypothetical protein